jgi:hypothetical protein
MMLAHYRQMSNAEFKQIQANRQLQETLVYSDTTESPYGAYLCIDTWWHAIEFLLEQETFEGSPLRKVVFGGTSIDGNDINDIKDVWFDFGPIRYFTPNQVQEISSVFGEVSPENLVARFNPALMAEHSVHPDNWWIVEQDEVIDSIKNTYSKLVAFFQKAAESANYVLTYITA